MDKLQIILVCLGTIGCILLVVGYLITFKNRIELIAGVCKNDHRIKDKKAFASLVGGNVLVLGVIFCAGTLGIYICPSCKIIIEPLILLSLLLVIIVVYTKSKKYIS